jgi:hypothetical protein
MLKKTLNIRGVGFHISDRLDEKIYTKWQQIQRACFVYRGCLKYDNYGYKHFKADTLRMLLDCYFAPQKIIRENVGLFWKEAKRQIKNENIITNEQVLNYLFDFFYLKNTEIMHNTYLLLCQVLHRSVDKKHHKKEIENIKKVFSI